jgi:predicted nucleic acid-binding protein
MARDVLVDAGFLIALLNRRDAHHPWAAALAADLAPPWRTCEAALSEAAHLLGPRGLPPLGALLRREAVVIDFDLSDNIKPVLALMEKYANVPMSLADGCLVRMTELFSNPILLTTDTDFRIYRRHSRQIIPCELPG